MFLRTGCLSNAGAANDRPPLTLDRDTLAGKPVARGTRLSVEFVTGLVADGGAEADVPRTHPSLSRQVIAACLACDGALNSRPTAPKA